MGKAGKLARLILLLPLIVCGLIATRILRPIAVFRFTWLPARLMGHAAVDPEMHLSMAKLGLEPAPGVVDLYFFEPARHSNDHWRKVVARHLRASELFYWIDRFGRRLPAWKMHSRTSYAERYSTSDPFDVLARSPQQICLSAKENEYGKAFLRQIGVPEGARFVCLQIRDGAHDRKHAPVGLPAHYNDFRNSPVEIFEQGIKYLVSKGYWVIRMGKAVAEPLRISHPMVIDYASSGKRTELADLWLCFNCSFMVSTGSGIDALAAIARKPVVCVDFLAYIDLAYFFRNSIVIFKDLCEVESGRRLSVGEALEVEARSYFKSADFYRNQGLSWRHNSPEEIVAAIAEMDERVNQRWSGESGDEVLQQRAGTLFTGHPQYSKIYGDYFVHRIGADFLRRRAADFANS